MVVVTLNSVAFVSASYQHRTQLNFPRSMARMSFDIACSPSWEMGTAFTVPQPTACIDTFGLGVKMQLTTSKLAALAIAVVEVIAAFALEKSWPFALTVAVGVLLPLALIWFPEFLGGLTGWGVSAPIDRPSPPGLVAMLGWLLLIGLPMLTLLLRRINP